jgi:FkbM family methyltransferase
VQRVRELLARVPGLRALVRSLRSLPSRLLGLPPTTYSSIDGELIRACVGSSDPTILEIGCNDGTTTLWLLEMFDNPSIYCFEPDPRAIARFKAKVPQDPRVVLFEMALSDREGIIDFYQSGGSPDELRAQMMPEGWDLSGSIRRPHRHSQAFPWVTFDHKISVVTSSLDTVCEKNGIGSIDFIWMDVQGAELEVLRGATTALRNTRYLYTEYSNRELYAGQPKLRDLVKFLRDFSLVVRYPGDALFRNTRLT